MRKLYLTFFILLLFVGNTCAQTYIMSTNTGGVGGYRTSFFPNGTYYYEYWIKKADGNLLVPIKEVGEYLIFDQKPTVYHFYAYRPESYSCSGPCGEEWDSSLEATNFNANCYSAVGGGGGRGGAEIVPEFSIISNQVLKMPSGETGFCDNVNLQVVGCTGPQRFFWEYRLANGTFKPTSVSTTFNQTFQFNRAAYVPSDYIGNIDFRVLIDSNSSITGEEIYSNIIYYNIIPCPPFLNATPITEKTSCIYKSDGQVTLSFDRSLISNEHFEFNFFTKDNVLIPTPSITLDATLKKYTFSGIAQGEYYIKYQTFIGAQQTSTNSAPYPTFKIEPPTQFQFEIIETQPSCYNESGKIQIKASGGTGPYLYKIDSGPEIEFTSITNEISVSNGDYYIKVTDKKDCIDTNAKDQKI